ncbi:MAG: QueT transporter family protein [Ruminococcaceae bacterium]|nr:QueT transporter family protein [Oscillospiraceae bacterium]
MIILKKTRKIVTSAFVAAVYAALTIGFSFISYGPIQFRISEALTVMPYFTPWAIPGLIIGCLTANIFSPISILDTVFGTLATAIGALGTYFCKKKGLWFLAPLCPVISNTVIISLFLTYMESGNAFDISILLFNALTVFVGEAVCCYGLGLPLMFIIKRINKKFSIY